MIVENCSVPEDNRVWLECSALVEAGYDVTVISPTGPDPSPYSEIAGVRIHRFPEPVESGSAWGFAAGYAVSWLRVSRLALRIWREHRFDLIHACNPPDTYFLLALAFRPFGVRFLFDQHDPCPEVYAARFARPSRLLGSILTRLERWSHATADHVITVNESCRELLLARNPTRPDRLTVVRSGPDRSRLVEVDPVPELKRGRRFLCSYVGVMGPQDGVDLIPRVARVLVHERGRTDVHFGVLGFGDCVPELKQLARDLDVADHLTFTGRVDRDVVAAYLSTSDLGLQPDPPSPFNQLCTMVKTLEYLAFGLPVVAFDLVETRRSAADAAAYVDERTPEAYADAIERLLDDDEERSAMGRRGWTRSHDVLSWDRQKPVYLDVVASLVGRAPARVGPLVSRLSR
jgi:glycosyltransferase involved in cell wall biosynthesis